MKQLIKILKFIKPFLRLFFISISLNIIFSIFTTLSIAIIKPIFQVLFNDKNVNLTQSAVPANLSFFEGIKNKFYDLISNLVTNPNDIFATLINLSILIIVIFILKNFFKYLGSVQSARLEESIVKSIRDKVFRNLTSLSVDFFTKRKEGSLISVITNDVSVVNSTTITSITNVLREGIQVILFLFLLLTISSYLTLIAFSTSLISLLILQVGIKFLRRYATRMQTAMADYTSALQETISGIRVIKAYTLEDSVNKRFTDQTDKYVRSSVKYQKIIALIPSTNELIAIIALCVVLFVGGSQVFKKELGADDLMLFLFSLFSIMSPISIVFGNISQFQRGFVAAERVFDIINQTPSVVTGKEVVTTFNTNIEVKDVTFSYEEINVIKKASFKINKGKKVAYVGASGSGKSTMLDLLIRFYDPTEGQILLDGKDIKNFNIESFRTLFGIVSQDCLLFNDTVANNIRNGLEGATIEQITEAAKTSNSFNFINNLPFGFDTYIGDRGVLLSGGEKQRISIARALVRNPQILIFDEATSALDSESEKIVQEAINQSLKERTAILVAHRLATIIDCDEIYVFDKGEIVEKGNHKELISRNGIYKKLYDIQFHDGINDGL